MSEITEFKTARSITDLMSTYLPDQDFHNDPSPLLSNKTFSPQLSVTQFSDAGTKVYASETALNDLLSKADKLISSGKKRQMCTESSDNLTSTEFLSKYVVHKSDEDDNVSIKDPAVEDIIKKYSDPQFSINDPLPRSSNYRIYPKTNSQPSYKPSFIEGCGEMGKFSSYDTGNNFNIGYKGMETYDKFKPQSCWIGKPAANTSVSMFGNSPSYEMNMKLDEQIRPNFKFDNSEPCNNMGLSEFGGIDRKNLGFGTVAHTDSTNVPNNFGVDNKLNNRSSPTACKNSGYARIGRKCVSNKKTLLKKYLPKNKSDNKSMIKPSKMFSRDKTNNGQPCQCQQQATGAQIGAGGVTSACQEEIPCAGGCGQENDPCAALLKDCGPKSGPCMGAKTGKKKKGGKKKPTRTDPRAMLAEAKTVYRENQKLKAEGFELKQQMESTRKGLMFECAKVLHSVLTFCEEKTQKAKNDVRKEDRHKICGAGAPQSKLGAGCSSGMCGGYTPSGWNKAGAMCAAETTDCLPPRSVAPCPLRGSSGLGESSGQQEGQDAVTSGVVDCNNCPSVRILGEMVFQLERRILEYVFGAEGKTKRRFYGYTVSNVYYIITKESTCPSGKTDTIGQSDKAARFEKIICALRKYGYNVKVHPEFCQNMVNKYGVLACPPDQCTLDTFRMQDPVAMSGLISRICGSPSEVANLNIVLKCLSFLAGCDGKPMFVW